MYSAKVCGFRVTFVFYKTKLLNSFVSVHRTIHSQRRTSVQDLGRYPVLFDLPYTSCNYRPGI